ncbi:MAG: hypothetical protein GX446_14820 [Chthonomonadales bacterium]|nr:hypothetical protein [Chthonomonadales bacterium]
MQPSRQSAARETLSEGAAEVKAKLKEDLSRWSRARRVVSLKPIIPCLECDGAGKHQCSACEGSGHSRLVLEDGSQDACSKCGGSGAITCVVCAGRGTVTNAYRKPMLWLLAAGGLAWLLILFQLWGRDVLPEQRARVFQRGEHGRAVVAPAIRQPSGGQGIVSPGPAAGSAAAPQGSAPPLQQGYGAAPQPSMGRPGQPPGAHGNSLQPGPGPATQGFGQPYGGNSVPYGGAGSPQSGR